MSGSIRTGERPSGRAGGVVRRRPSARALAALVFLVAAWAPGARAAAGGPVSPGRPTVVRWSFRLTAPEASFRLESHDPATGTVLRTWWRDAAAGVPDRGWRLLAVADEGGGRAVHYRLWVRSRSGEESLLAETSAGPRPEPVLWERLESHALELISPLPSPAPAGLLAIRRRAGSRPRPVDGLAGPAGKHGTDLGVAHGPPRPHLERTGVSLLAVVDVPEAAPPGADPPPPRRTA